MSHHGTSHHTAPHHTTPCHAAQRHTYRLHCLTRYRVELRLGKHGNICPARQSTQGRQTVSEVTAFQALQWSLRCETGWSMGGLTGRLRGPRSVRFESGREVRIAFHCQGLAPSAFFTPAAEPQDSLLVLIHSRHSLPLLSSDY